MSGTSSIEWTDKTWNPVRGCALVSPGCTNCYAMKFAHRFSGAGKPYEGLTRMTKGGPVWTGKVALLEDELDAPIRWRKPARIFVNSMSDLFHEDIPDEFITKVWTTMAEAPRHVFQILTKRPQRMLDYLLPRLSIGGIIAKPLPNVWLGVSVEDQARADERIPLLLQTPAAVRWISAEPLLGEIRLGEFGESWLTWLPHGAKRDREPGIDWVIAGGESGPGARPMHPDWVRLLRDQCAAAGVPFFFKQWGAWKPVRTMEALTTPGRGMLIDAEGKIPPLEEIQKLARGNADLATFVGRVHMKLVGKKTAGRELDGRTHDEYPS